MASLIDFSKPVYGNPSTQSVRDNFQIAQTEITNLQQLVAPGPFLALGGGIMTGPVTLSRDPQGALEAVTKQYVDDIAFGSTGSLPDAPSDGMFYARGGGVTSLATPNEWKTTPLFSSLQIGSDRNTILFGLDSDASYNFYRLLSDGNNYFRFHRTNKLLEFIINGNVNAAFSDTAITFNRAVHVSNGINFGGLTGSSATDMSKHIILHGVGYGFSITAGRLNYLVSGGAHVFMFNGADVVTINNGGIGLNSNTDIFLSRDPTTALHATTKQYVDNKISGQGPFLPLAGGTVTGQTTFNTFLTVGTSTTNNGSLTLNSFAGTSAHIGFQSGGLTRWAFGRNGDSESGSNAGSNFFIDRYNDAGAYIDRFMTVDRAGGNISFNSGYFAIIYNGTALSFNPGLAGGSYNGIVQTNDAVLITHRGNANTSALTLAPWANGFLGIRIDSVTNSIVLTATGGTISVGADPTTALGIATKQYTDAKSDRNKTRGLIDVTSNSSPTVDQVDYAYMYLYGNPTGLSIVTMPVATTTRVLWTMNNAQPQPVRIQGVGGGSIDIPGGASMGVWTDTGGIYALYNAGQTRPPGDSTVYWATTQFVDNSFLKKSGGTMSGLSFGQVTVTAAADFSKHIALYDGFAGISVTPGCVNIYANGNLAIYANGLAFGFDSTTITAYRSLTLNADPTAPLHAATKQYADTKLSLTGGTVTGGTRFNTGLNAGTSNGPQIVVAVDGASGVGSGYAFYSGGFQRWLVAMDHYPETGGATGNGGVNLSFYSYNNDGSYHGQPFVISRDTGHVFLLDTMTVGRDPTSAMEVATKQYVDSHAGGLPLTGGTLSGGLSFGAAESTGVNDTSRHITLYNGWGGFSVFTSGAYRTLSIVTDGVQNVYFDSGGMGMGVNKNLTLYQAPSQPFHAATKKYVDDVLTGGAGTINGNLNVTGNIITGGPFAIVPAGGSATIQLKKKTAADFNTITGYTANSVRWNIILGDSTAESGSNTGSDWGLYRYSDAGNYIDAPIFIRRSDGMVAIGNLIVSGSAFKPGGGPWTDSSDSRIKTVTGDYKLGLNEILKLNPIRFRFKGNDRNDKYSMPNHIDTELEHIGLVAQDVENILPEAVTQRKGFIDEKEVDDLRMLDLTSLPLALVNAIKELYSRITLLEARLTTQET